MGCDIHLYSESRNKQGKWVADHASTFNSDSGYFSLKESYDGNRSYTLFGLLAKGVRGDYSEAFRQRGIPQNVSDEIRQIHTQEDCGAHSASHLSVAELKEKAAYLLLLTDEESQYLRNKLIKLVNGLPPSDAPNDQRIVFWFDN